MGNCIGSKVSTETEKQFIKVMKMDGKVLEYYPPLAVRDLLVDHDQNFMVVHSEKVGVGLPIDYKLVGGEIYYLIRKSHVGVDHKSFSAQRNCCGGGRERVVEDVASNSFGDRAVKAEKQLKFVVSKKQLKELVSNDYLNVKLVEELLVKQFESKALHQGASFVPTREWRPCLERILEVE